ncbi:ParB/RepB/Spo0J family plasmid partition protein [Pantoea sp. LMR881]|uniref:ParB/RepB/Spo0J family plasmid partition protein n=1 Tax=Pantoea sp. LMR881 TaxID=3014336 RepID=UPI0022AFDBAC|nr:ParB/RepB/Spo0J family plasmid partition protein [Pantoea sp. LMR881]MCZ4061066.1 ParB/RepB/Spo0J family plasmid partition protein [Pantoea sp. LMR881]
MKRAPVITKSSPAVTSANSTAAPAAPMVDSLMSRVGAMAKGNAITLPVCGREVRFVLETIPGENIEKTTRVWGGNERDQDLLTKQALDDLIPSFLVTGQQNPAFGRKVNDSIEVADGSRRRMAAILTATEYRILIGDLDDEQMDALCKLGNDYRPTSAYERGKRYSQRLANEFNGNLTALADAEHVSRKIISRCINVSRLPKEVIALFSHPGELSARAGENLQKTYSGKEEILLEKVRILSEKQQAGGLLEADSIINFLTKAVTESEDSRSLSFVKREFLPGAVAQYKGNKVIFNLDRSKLPENCIEKIEEMLEQLQAFQSR